MGKIKLSCDTYKMVRALSYIDGAHGHALDEGIDKDENYYWLSLIWLDDDYAGYYMGYDHAGNGYVIEWRGDVMVGSKTFHEETMRVITYTGGGYVLETAEALAKAIRKHRKSMKDAVVVQD